MSTGKGLPVAHVCDKNGRMAAQEESGPGGAGNTVNPGPNPCEGGAVNQSTHAHALYRFYGDTGQLLYVGITNDPGRRFGQHASTKSWWQAVRGISIDWYSSREDALAAETRAIRIERPLANVIRPAMPATVPPRCGHCPACNDGDNYCLMYCDLEEDEERIVDPCDKCGRPDCLYVLGYDTGSQHGWSAAWGVLHEREREAQERIDG